MPKIASPSQADIIFDRGEVVASIGAHAVCGATLQLGQGAQSDNVAQRVEARATLDVELRRLTSVPRAPAKEVLP